ncbi:glycosyltransferase [Photobacterium sp. MCCC 1A19761]
MQNQNFSVLMSVYIKEKPDYLDSALKSILVEQTMKPEQLVLVQDGPLNDQLLSVVNRYVQLYPQILCTVEIKENVGLGQALNIGLSHCRNELVARMDTDDISCSNRFERQLEVFNNNPSISVCGGFIEEFDIEMDRSLGLRSVPSEDHEIRCYSRSRNPVNHVTVMFKKHDVFEAGGYKTMLFFEDYYLWCRMLKAGKVFHNVNCNLVNVRAGQDMLSRRRGLSYLKFECKFLFELYRIEHVSFVGLLKMLIIRAPMRLLPKQLLFLCYKVTRSLSTT